MQFIENNPKKKLKFVKTSIGKLLISAIFTESISKKRLSIYGETFKKKKKKKQEDTSGLNVTERNKLRIEKLFFEDFYN